MTNGQISDLLDDAISAVNDDNVLDAVANDSGLLAKATTLVEDISSRSKAHPQLPDPTGESGCFYR